MKYLQWSSWIVGLTLQYLVTLALLAGPLRQFSVVFAYMLCLSVTTLTDILIAIDAGKLASRATRFYFYWTADLIRETALYAVIISLVLYAMPDNRRRAALIRLMVAVAFLFWIGSLLVYYQEPTWNKWMVKVARNLSFSNAVATLILWFVLIASDKRDTRLLVVTGGLGLQMTGEAIGQSLRQISKSTELIGQVTMLVAHFLCLYIWWRAFSAQPEPSVRNPEKVSI